MASLEKIVAFSDKHLRLARIEDYANALNGLQVENSGVVTKIGAAVDASSRTLRGAAARKVDLLVVHHGLFWSGANAVTGPFHRQLRLAFAHNIAVYSVHLPLDLHPELGNNAQLAAALGLNSTKPFFEYKGTPIGLVGKGGGSARELAKRLEKAVGGPVKAFFYGPPKPRIIGVVTGGGGSEIHEVARAKVDTFITGEAPHWAGVAAEELGMNLLLGGHYATETFGVKAFAALLAKKFSLPWTFIDCPTGL